MSLWGATFGFVLIAGCIGGIVLFGGFRWLPAEQSIDHPSGGLRIFFRLMAIFAFHALSFILTTAFLGALLPIGLFPLDASDTELKKVVVMLLLAPLPLTSVFYMLYAKLTRWLSRQ